MSLDVTTMEVIGMGIVLSDAEIGWIVMISFWTGVYGGWIARKVLYG